VNGPSTRDLDVLLPELGKNNSWRRPGVSRAFLGVCDLGRRHREVTCKVAKYSATAIPVIIDLTTDSHDNGPIFIDLTGDADEED